MRKAQILMLDRIAGILEERIFRLTEKQLANFMDRLKAGVGRALRLLDNGFCLPETRRRFADLILDRIKRLEMR